MRQNLSAKYDRCWAAGLARGSNMRQLPRKGGGAIALLGVVTLGALLLTTLVAAQTPLPERQLGWPSNRDHRQVRPWVYWWWMGSAVNKEDLTAVLTSYREAGLGGVHIVPIYGVKGQEDRFLRFLSDNWMEMLSHTLSEAKRLDLGVDMTCGTGWPFGGPNISAGDSASRFELIEYPLRSNQALNQPIRYSGNRVAGTLVTLQAFSDSGDSRDLTKKVDSEGRLDWTPDTGDWMLYALFSVPFVKEVERAAPGGEGFAIDYFSRSALSHYLQRFNLALNRYNGKPVRAYYNDSFEIPKANWTRDLFDEFQSRCGYDLRRHLPELAGRGGADTVARVKGDFRGTLSDLLLEEFVKPWTAWAHQAGSLTRNQAHGMPGNLLDLYAAADIPETESFGSSGFQIPHLRVDADYPREVFGTPNKLVFKFASSAAHVSGKSLVSSESATWLGEHFRVALSQVKPELDKLFLGGINHVFYHGNPFSPPAEPWPGWLFYASTHFGPTNSFWRDFRALNSYVARVQSFLQSGRPDNDLLLYFPIHDLWHDAEGLQKPLSVHNTDAWLEGTTFYLTARQLDTLGYTFDYISDRQILNLKVNGSSLNSPGGNYHAILIPDAKLLPLSTLEELQTLAREGATVVFLNALPVDVPGLADLAGRRSELERMLSELDFRPSATQGVEEAGLGSGHLLRGPALQPLMDTAQILSEPMTESGLQFIRRRWDEGHIYFCANLGKVDAKGWFELATPAESVAVLNPLNGLFGSAALQPGSRNHPAVYLQLRPGESIILKTLTNGRFRGRAWSYLEETGTPIPVEGSWDVRFTSGGPVVPGPRRLSELESWTSWQGEASECFSGTAVYSIRFEKPPAAETLILDLGRVAESARVSLNGRLVETVVAHPFRIELRGPLKEKLNLLEIEVSNLMANRIRCLDIQKRVWRKFYDINFVNIKYQPFDASGWQPMDSGLLGPVRLIPARILNRADELDRH